MQSTTTPIKDIGAITDLNETTDSSSTNQLISPNALVSAIDGTESTGQYRRDIMASQIAGAKGKLIDEPTLSSASVEVDPAQALSRAADDVFNQMKATIAENTARTVGEEPSSALSAIETMNADIGTVNAMQQSPVANELAVLQNAATIPLSEAVHKEMAFNLAARNELSRMMDEQGMLDFMLDVGGMFVPFRNTTEWEDIKANIDKNPELQKFITGESIAGMIGSWQALPTERKQALFPELVKTVLASTGIEGGPALMGENLTDKNTAFAVSALLRFLQPEGGERASIEQKALLGLDVLAVLPALKGAAKAGSPFNFESKAGARSSTTGGPRRPTPEAGPTVTPRNPVTVDGEFSVVNVEDLYKLPKSTRMDMEAILLASSEFINKQNNIVALLAKGGDVAQAARVNVAALTSPVVRRATGISTDDAIVNAMPFQTREWLPQATQGLVPEVATEINNFIMKTEGLVRSMSSESDLMRIGALSQTDRKLALRSFEKEVTRVAEDYLQEGITLSNMNIIKESPDAFEFEYTLTNKEGDVQQFTGRRSWAIDQVTGKFTETVKELSENAQVPGLSPSAWSLYGIDGAKDFHDSVVQAIQLDDIATATKQRINKVWVEANDSLSGPTQFKARQRIEAIEEAGDAYVNPDSQEIGRVFMPEELYAGINTKRGTIRLTTPEEVTAYYKRRLFADSLHSIQNAVSRRELELARMKAYVVAPNGNEQMVFLKPFPDRMQAMQSVANKPWYYAWDSVSHKVVELTTDHINKVYDSGRVVGRMRSDWNVTGNDLTNGGEFVEYMIIDPNKVMQLPEQVLHYKHGYVPKIHENVEFVVKQVFPITKRGVRGASKSEAMRMFASRKDAEKFMEQQAQLHSKRFSVPIDAARAMFTIEDGAAMGQLERMEDALSSSNGLFTGTRAKQDILVGLNGVPSQLVSPSEAFGRYIDHLGTKVSHNEWRIGTEKEWLNTVKRAYPKLKLNGFNGTALPDDEVGRALRKLHDQIDKWNKTPSRKESLMEGAVQKLHDWVLEGTRGLGIKKENIASILYLKHAEPLNAILAANMHVMLGALNPAQLYVQASAATIALSIAPISEVPGIIERMAVFSALDNIRDETALGKVISLLTDRYPDLLEAMDSPMYMAWRRSGLLESVRGNADLNYMSSTGLGLSADVMRKAGNVSLMIYRTAELVNRRASFITAFVEYENAHPNAKITDDVLSTILSSANRYMLELNGANKAWWQGGAGANGVQKVLQMTTQFMQVLAKTVELALKGQKRGGFDWQQKARFMSGQLLMFGAVGVPLVSMVGPAMVSWMADKSGLDPRKPEDAKVIESMGNAFNQGLAGVIAWEMLGARVDVSGRAALGSNIISTVKDIVTSKDPAWAKVLGVAGETGRRAAEVGMQLKAIGNSQALAALGKLEPLMMYDRRGTQELAKTDLLMAAKDIGSLLLQIPSTGRQVLKARLMHSANTIMDGRGRVKVLRDFNFETEIGVALGFQPTEESRLRDIMLVNDDYEAMVKEASDIIVAAYHRYAYRYDMNPAYAANLNAVVQYIQESLGNDYLVEKLRASLEQRIFTNPSSIEEQELNKLFNTVTNDQIIPGLILDGQLSGRENAVIAPFADIQNKAEGK